MQIALETEERKALEALVRRVAAAGGLDSADLREGFQVHGLEAAFRVEVSARGAAADDHRCTDAALLKSRLMCYWEN